MLPQTKPYLNAITQLRYGLATHGYRVVPVEGKKARGTNWQKARWKADQMAGLTRNHEGANNTGILAGDVVALDVDTPDPEVAEAIKAMVAELPTFAAAPYRIGRAPKCCYLFRAAEPRRRVASGKYLINGHACQIEVLGIGQQFVAYGTHPETLRPYEWFNGSPAETPLEDLPIIEVSDIDALLRRAEPYLAERGDLLVKGVFTPASANDNQRAWESIDADPDSPWTELKQRAFANLSAWVPNLPLDGLVDYNGGYRAVASFRPTNSATAKVRGKALNIQSGGICDYADDNRGYSPIDLVAVCLGVEPLEAFDWLGEHVGFPDDGTKPLSQDNIASISGQNERRAAKAAALAEAKATMPAETAVAALEPTQATVAAVVATEAGRALPKLPYMLENPMAPDVAGGLLGDVAEWITKTAVVPVPELSMTSAIALLGGMFGSKALGPTQSGLNIFATTLLDTAGGKGHPPKAIRSIAGKAGRPGTVTNGDPTSYSAIERVLRKNASTVIVFDEFGVTLQDVNGRNASSPAASIRKFLLAIYDQANSVFDGRIYASAETKKVDDPIKGPALTVLGMTTPETLYAGLSQQSISDGFINRFVFVTGTPPKHIKPPALHRLHAPPELMVKALQEADLSFPKPAGNLGIGKVVVEFDGGQDGEAYALWSEVFLWQHSPDWNETERNINGRAAENTIRLATIRAVSRSASEPLVTAEDVAWGWAIVHASIDVVTRGAEKHMSASPAEALRKSITAALQDASGYTLPLSKLMVRKGVSGADHHNLKSAIQWLMDSGEIVEVSGRKSLAKGAKFRWNSFGTRLE